MDLFLRTVKSGRALLIAFALVVGAAGASAQTPVSAVRANAGLSDSEFWALSQNSSEPGGFFRQENITNLTSNELWFEYVVPDLMARARADGVYLGVGPEQNFTYMAALRPRLAIIFDIRRGNLDLQLLYKAIFELAADRADFVSMLFAKPRPAGLTERSTVVDIFTAYRLSPTSEGLYKKDLAAIEARLTVTHGLALSADDRAGLESVYFTFYSSGFAVRPSPTYADLMTATDEAGVAQSFLASEGRFAIVKDLETRNLVVPVVGDFGGPKALRAIAAYLSARRATVSAFYLSNVEQYLVQDGKWDAFCRNVAALPLDDSSTFIRSQSGGGFLRGPGGGFVSSLGAMAAEVRSGCGR